MTDPIIATDTLLYLGDIVIPLRAAAGFTETWTDTAAPEFMDTWNGATTVLSEGYKRKYDVKLACTGDGARRSPGLDRVQAGDTVTMWSNRWMTWSILTGESSAILPRDPVPGMLKVIHPDPADTVNGEIEVDFTYDPDTGTVSLAEATDIPLAISYRPIVVCKAGAIGFTSAGWSLDLREAAPPRS